MSRNTYHMEKAVLCKIHGSNLNKYTVLHIFAQVLFCAGDQSNHQILPYKFWLIFMGMKQKKLEKNPEWLTQKNWVFQNLQFSIFFRQNFRDWSLGE